MQISEIRMMIVRLRLRKEFKHASFNRNYSDNLVVRCQLADGTIGWGEGVPREYVTGETAQGAIEQIQAADSNGQLAPLGESCRDWTDVVAMCDAYQPPALVKDPRACKTNAHRCAVELSVLDAFGRHFQSPVADVIDHVPECISIAQRCQRVQYSSAISSGRPRKEILSALAMRLYGFAHCKVKVGMQSDRDPERLRRMRRWVGSRMDLRVDANEAWSPDQVVRRIDELHPFGISCVEQPLPHADVAALNSIRHQIDVPIMLDESLTGQYDAARAIDTQMCDLFNIRLSKCGGYLNSLRLAAMASNAGLGYQLGCHPGESPILSAAGRQFVTSVADTRYREGSADRHLLKESFATSDLTFGRGGWAPVLNEPGLGVSICEQRLAAFVLRTEEFHLQ